MPKYEWSKLPEKSFYFIRHGQTDWNAEHKAMGVADISLNSIGEDQSRQAISLFDDLNIKYICYSPLKRAFRTAEILNETLGCEMIPIDDLKEFNLGSCAGKIISDWFDEWMNGKNPPEAESYHEFIERAIRGINAALQHDGPTLIVAHGGIYWAIQRAINRLDLPDLPNCCLVHFKPLGSNKNWSCIIHCSQPSSLNIKAYS